MSSSVREPKHFAYIDALRGYAFLGVLCVHCSAACGAFPGSMLANQGGFGVQLFFLASAITLCFSMSTRREGKMDVANFYVRRLFRIAPLFWLAMIVYWTVPGVIPRIWLTQWAPDGVNGLYFLLTALFLQGWHPYTFNSIVPGGWSIAVEMTFYLVFPFCFHHISTACRAAACLLAGIVLTVAGRFLFFHIEAFLWPEVPNNGIMDFFRQYWFFSQFVVFLLGIFIYFLLREPVVQQFARNRFWACWLLVISLVFLVSLLNHGAGGFLPPILIVIALSGLVVALSGHAVPLAVNPLICHLGKLSYSCYLTHFAAVEIVMRSLHTLLPRYAVQDHPGTVVLDFGSGYSNLGAFVLVSSATLILTVIFSTVTYHLIESPGIALGRSLIRKMNQRNALPRKNLD